VDRALDLTRLTEALGQHVAHQGRTLPSPSELQELLAEAEVAIFLRRTDLPAELIRTAWYLHGVAAADARQEVHGWPRQRQAFEVSAHIFDLALNDLQRSRAERLELAFGAAVGYRRADLDPNATAVFRRVEDLLVIAPPVENHLASLGLEVGVAFLGFQTTTLFELLDGWLRQLRGVANQVGSTDLWGTMFGPPHRVAVGARALLNYLAFGDEQQLSAARESFTMVVLDDAGGDLDSQWVAAHLLDLADHAQAGSLWHLMPPDVPPVARQAFTLASPPILTLWPPQRELLAREDGRDPLALETRRVILSIPTSSGKTLIAQLMIVAHLAAGGGGVCYVAPMRSLGREVRTTLRNRLRVIARQIGREAPDYSPLLRLFAPFREDEIPTVEEAARRAGVAQSWLEQLLADFGEDRQLPDVEVMTPERLAHLLHRDPEAVLDRFQLFVFDEAHLIGERGRGFTLEAVLSFIHWRTRARLHRIVLLSAAIGNRAQLQQWLDPDREGTLISSTWRGPRSLHAVFNTRPDWLAGVESNVRSADWPIRVSYPVRAAIRLRPAGGLVSRTLTLAQPVGTLARRRNVAGTFRSGKEGAPHSTQQYKMTARVVSALGSFGSILVITSTRQIAQDMAAEIAEALPSDSRAIPLVDFAVQRLGADHPLIAVLRKGVAFHHAALPVDVLEEIEEATRAGTLRFMTATTTLTEGVNLPVRTVVIAETQWEDQDPGARFTGARLVNAMGRAGRAGRESEGWIVLVRAAEERAEDFDLLRPSDEELEVRSQLAADSTLTALAEFEDALRADADVLFVHGASVINDFVSFVWFLLASEEGRGVGEDALAIEPALASTLGFTQLGAAERQLWADVAEATRSAYIRSDPVRRRRWAHAGTSVASARRLDELADTVVAAVLATSEDVNLRAPHPALALVNAAGVLSALLDLPESPRSWRFRATRSGQSAAIEVEPALLLDEWISGAPIPDLANRFLGSVVDPGWRVEQIVDTLAQHFEHFLSWTLGVVLELANARLQGVDAAQTLCEELPAYVRYGVDSRISLLLLLSGVRSRRLASLISAQAAADDVDAQDLRPWLGRMAISEWRDRFEATSSELLDLLEYARSPRSSTLRTLLEEGQAVIAVDLENPSDAVAEGTAPASGADIAGEGNEARGQAVVIRPLPDEEDPPRLGVFGVEPEPLLALIPTPTYGDIRAVLDTGVPVEATLEEGDLRISIRPPGDPI
jgi:hypothetical protein